MGMHFLNIKEYVKAVTFFSKISDLNFTEIVLIKPFKKALNLMIS